MKKINPNKIRKIPTVPMDDSLKYNFGVTRFPKDNVHKPKYGGAMLRPTYKYKGGKIGDGNYKACGANIIRTK